MTRPAPPSPETTSASGAEIDELRKLWLASGRSEDAFNAHVKSSAHVAAIRGILGVTGQRQQLDPPKPPPAVPVIRNTQAVEDSLPFGPAMQKLSPMRQRFVLELLRDDRDDGAAAARAAGYSDNGTSAKVQASRLRHDPAVRAAIHEVAVAQLSSLQLLATSTVREVMADPTARAADRLKAAAMVYDRSGMPAQGEHHIVVEHKRTEAELVADIIKLAKQLGMDPKAVLGNAGVVLEGEYSVVTEPAGSKLGLEDVL